MKERLKIWVWLVLIYLCISTVVKNFNNFKNIFVNKNKVDISIQFDNNSIDDKYLLFKTKRIKTVKSNGDIIVGKNLKLDDSYEKIENGFYSPMVLYFISNGSVPDFLRYEEINDQYCIDLRMFFDSLEKDDKEFEAYKKQIFFPAKTNAYYQTMMDLMVYTLNDFKIPNNEELLKLTTRAENIMNKCSSYNNSEDLKSNKNKNFVFMCEQSKDILFNDSGYSLFIPTQTTNNTYDLYIKKDKKDIIINYLSKDKKIYKYLRIRNIFNKKDIYTFKTLS